MIRRLIVPAVVILMIAACGDDTETATTTEAPPDSSTTTVGSTTSSTPTTTTSSTTSTTTLAPTTTTTEPQGLVGFPFGSLEAGARVTDTFPVPITVELGEGWTGQAPENRFRIDLLHESGGRLAFDLSKAEFTVDEVLAELLEQAGFRDDGGLEVFVTTDIDVAGVTGMRAEGANLDDSAFFIRALTKAGSLEGFVVQQIPVSWRIDVLDVDGTTLILYAGAPPEVFESFILDVIEPILASMTIG